MDQKRKTSHKNDISKTKHWVYTKAKRKLFNGNFHPQSQKKSFVCDCHPSSMQQVFAPSPINGFNVSVSLSHEQKTNCYKSTPQRLSTIQITGSTNTHLQKQPLMSMAKKTNQLRQVKRQEKWVGEVRVEVGSEGGSNS